MAMTPNNFQSQFGPFQVHALSKLFFLVIMLATVSVVGQTDKDHELRTWRDILGHKIKARLIRFRPPTVYLKDELRKTVQIHPKQLSKEDQDYVLGILRKEKKDELAKAFADLADMGQSDGSGQPGGSEGSDSSDSSGNGSPSSRDDKPPSSSRGAPKRDNASPGRSGSHMKPGVSPRGDSPFLAEAGMPPNRGGGAVTPESYVPSLPKDGRMQPNGNPESRVKNPNVDPFADLRPPESGSVSSRNPNLERESMESGSSRKPITNSRASQSTSYQPPVIQNKFDDTRDIAPERTESSMIEKSSDQTILLIALGIIAFLLLVMIALLVMVLVKSKRPRPRRSYF